MPRLPVLRILSVALFAAALTMAVHGCKSSKNPMAPGGGTTADKTINILGMLGSGSYSGDPDTVTVGQTVAWHNSDGTTHTATSATFNTGNIAPGGTSAAITMGTAGSFPYHCSIHPTMTGTLVVKP